MNIVIIEQNKIFRESLKTVIDQISGFKVVFDTDDFDTFIQKIKINDIQIVFIDNCFYQKENMISIFQLLPNSKILVLTNYMDKCFFEKIIDTPLLDFIPKSSNKRSIEEKIRNLIHVNIIKT